MPQTRDEALDPSSTPSWLRLLLGHGPMTPAVVERLLATTRPGLTATS